MRKLLLLALLLLSAPLIRADDIDDETPMPETGTPSATMADDIVDETPMPETEGAAATMDEDAGDFDDPFEDDEDYVEVCDPLEPMNRGIFWVNDKLYFYLMKPVARAYRIIPESARTSVGNFFSNVATPVRFINAGLQGKFGDAGNELLRFVVNTTVGILGLFDPARNHMDINKKDEDTGQTLGVWGIGPGCYLMLPVLGPSNFRDAVGRVGDYYMDPWVYIFHEDEWEYFGVKALDVINFLSLDKDTYEGIKRDELDPYLFIRDAYMQHRAGKVKK